MVVQCGDEWRGVVDDGRVEMVVTLPDRPAPVVWQCWESAAPELVRTVDDPLLDQVIPNAVNVLVVPITADEEPIGVVVAEWGGEEGARIPTTTVQGLAQAAAHTGLALRNAELLVEVERLATRDSLTGIANRRLFDESLERETARSQRLGAPLSLVVFDIDHFKQINDTFGHQTGDAVLCEVADALVASTKGFDVAARFGGDEFVLLLPGCARTDALGVAERVRRRGRAAHVVGVGHRHRGRGHDARQRGRRRAPRVGCRRRALRGEAPGSRPRARVGARRRRRGDHLPSLGWCAARAAPDPSTARGSGHTQALDRDPRSSESVAAGSEAARATHRPTLRAPSAHRTPADPQGSLRATGGHSAPRTASADERSRE